MPLLSHQGLPQVPTDRRSSLQPNEQIPTQFACSLLRMLSEHGLDVAEACASASLDFDPLDPTAPGYRSEIPIIAYSRLYRGVMTAL